MNSENSLEIKGYKKSGLTRVPEKEFPLLSLSEGKV